MDERFRGFRAWLDEDDEDFFLRAWRGGEPVRQSNPEPPPEIPNIDESDWASIALE